MSAVSSSSDGARHGGDFAKPALTVRIVNELLRVEGRLQAIAMAFRLSSGEMASILAGALILAVEILPSLGDAANDSINPLVIALGALAVIMPAFRETAQLLSDVANYRVKGSEEYKAEVLNRLELSPSYLGSGYVRRVFEDGGQVEHYVASNLVDRMLSSYGVGSSVDEGRAVLLDVDKRRYRIPEEVRPVVLSALHDLFSRYKGKRLTNGSLVKMSSDLLVVEGGCNSVSVQKVRYFDGQCTHELVFKRAPRADRLAECFYGDKLLLDEDGKLIELWNSRCANFIGVSTLALTSDGMMVLGRQGRGSMANTGRLAPSGSGSVEYSDIASIRAKGPLVLHELLKYAAERELREECGLPAGDKYMSTQVIGYARLLERGGKPDFFCLTRLDITSAEVKSYHERNLGLSERTYLSGGITFVKSGDEPLSRSLGNFLEDARRRAGGEHAVSIQLHILEHNLAMLEEMNLSASRIEPT